MLASQLWSVKNC